MKKLIIVGASGFGRELMDCIYDINKQKPTWEIVGFIDDNPKALDGFTCDYNIIDDIQHHSPLPDTLYVCALAFPEVKKKIVKQLKERGAKFATLIHPLAAISPSAKIGEGCIITHFSNVSCDTKVGDFVTVLASGIAHDVTIGDFSTFSGHVYINGQCKVGEGVYMGCGSMIAPSKKIGDYAKIGIGSVIISNVKPNTTVFGNPAKKI